MENPYRALSEVNPKREEGTRQINNEVWHALIQARLTGAEYQVIMTIIDRSWGFTRHTAFISLKHFEDATLLSRQGAIKAIKAVESKHFIVRHTEKGKTTEYLFNKHYDTWLLSLTSEPQLPSASEPQLPSASEPQLTSASEPQLTSPVNHSLLVQSTTVDRTSEPQLTSPGGGEGGEGRGKKPLKKPLKKLIKKEIYKGNKLLAEISKLYSGNIGPVKPALADELGEFCKSFNCPVSWIKLAFQEALSRNKKSWHYVRAILESWAAKGGPDDKSSKGASKEVDPDKYIKGRYGHVVKR